jgi:hypothetical protein
LVYAIKNPQENEKFLNHIKGKNFNDLIKEKHTSLYTYLKRDSSTVDF